MTKRLSKMEGLCDECKNLGIHVITEPLPHKIRGLYYSDEETDPIISIDPSVTTQSETCCIIAEELGHYHTSCGNLLTDKSVKNTTVRQQETRAKRWAYEKLVPLDKIISAYNAGVKNRYELSQYLDVIEDFLEQALKYYNEKHGVYKILGNYIIYFEPLGVCKMFE